MNVYSTHAGVHVHTFGCVGGVKTGREGASPHAPGSRKGPPKPLTTTQAPPRKTGDRLRSHTHTALRKQGDGLTVHTHTTSYTPVSMLHAHTHSTSLAQGDRLTAHTHTTSRACACIANLHALDAMLHAPQAHGAGPAAMRLSSGKSGIGRCSKPSGRSPRPCNCTGSGRCAISRML